MKKSFALLLMAMALLMTGCSPYTLVNSEVYNGADMADYHTFRIVTPDQGNLPHGMQMMTYYNIAAAIREQLVERGFTEDPDSPLLVNIAVTVQREIDTAPAFPYGVPGPYFGPGFRPGFYPSFIYPRPFYWNPNAQVITGIYKEGVLTMDMVNLQKKEAVYSASVATVIDGSQQQYRNLQGIAEAVETLFSKFPVPLLPQYKK